MKISDLLSIGIMAAVLTSACAIDVQQLIDEAVARGEKSVTLPAGTHRIDRGIRLSELRGFTFDGGGSTLVFTNLRDGGFAVRDCVGLTLRNFTVDFDPLPFTQATVESVNRETGEVFFALHEGYPDLAPHYLGGRALAFSPETLKWKTSTPDLYANEARALDPRRGVLVFSPEKKATLETIAPGDYLALDFRNSRSVRIEDCQDIRVENVTFWSAPSIAVICRFMDGENTFSYTIERGPLPPGARIPRLLSVSADGLNYAYARRGPVIENCRFSFMGDDSVNLHGIAFYVGRVDGNVVYLLRPYPEEAFTGIIRPGDEVLGLASDSFDVKGSSRVKSFSVEANPSEDFSELASRVWTSRAVKAGKLTVYRLELEGSAGLNPGDFLEIPAIAAPGYVIRNNHFHDHRGRGLRLMSSEGLVENNVLEDIKQAAITLGPEFTFFREAGWIRDVTIRNNIIRRVGFDPVTHLPQTYAPGAIAVFHRGETPEAPRPAMRHRNIKILGNRIEETGGPAVHIAQACDVEVAGNPIGATNQIRRAGVGSVYGLSADKPIVVEHSENVTLDEAAP